MIVTLGASLRFSLRTDDKALRDMRHAAVSHQLETAYAAILAGPRRISLKEAYELAGVLYRDLNAGFEDDPLDANWWRIVSEVAKDALSGPVWPPSDLDNSAPDRRLQVLERYVGPFVDATLLRLGVNAAAEDRPMFLRAFAERLADVATKLERNAEGNFASDPVADQIPKWRGNKPTPTSKTSVSTFDELLTRWKKEIKPRPPTISKYQTAVTDFKAHIKHNDPFRVNKADLIAWKVAMLDRQLSPKTIKDDRLAAIRALYNFAKRNDLLDTNPVDGVTISAKPKPGETMLPYDDAEVAAILSLADNETDSKLRWIPWLLALTGARVGEIAQLWAKRVTMKDGISTIRLTVAEDGGDFKNVGSERDVPLHPAILERGFLAFVKTRPNGGPLFYGGKAAKPSGPRKSETSRHTSTYVVRDVQEWVRGKGFTDQRKAPNHAFRHWFKTKCADLDIQDSIADAIQGHTERSAAAGYRKISLAKMVEAIRKIEVPTMPDL